MKKLANNYLFIKFASFKKLKKYELGYASFGQTIRQRQHDA